jgi:hypothetical protein
MNIFVAEVDKFMANYSKLILPSTRAEVYASGNPELIANYETAVTRGRILKSTIEGTVGAWNAAKRAWGSVTDVTSTVIGDAIDWVRGIFGDGPNADLRAYQASPISGGQLGRYDVSPISGGQLGALGALQLPAAAWVAGIISSAYLLNSLIEKIWISIEATRIQKANPNIPRDEAINAAAGAVKRAGILGDFDLTLPLVAAAAIAAFLIFGKK